MYLKSLIIVKFVFLENSVSLKPKKTLKQYNLHFHLINPPFLVKTKRYIIEKNF